MLKSTLAALIVLSPLTAYAAGGKAHVTDADRTAYAKMTAEQAYDWLGKLTARTCPDVKVEAPMSRSAAIFAIKMGLAPFDKAVAGIEDVCRKAIASRRASK